MRAILVTHTHWDREWYRTFQGFRARLVDAVDRVLELCAADPGYHFLLDGQTAAIEDYLEIRPERAEELRARCAEGRIGLGPWYVQPDSLLPSGEAHVRNLLLGRRVGETAGPVSRVGYTPDSFGHPAQLPQLLAGFGIDSFVYWRGNGDELDTLPPEYWWEGPDGSAIVACHLGKGYFCAATPPGADPDASGARIATTAKKLAERTRSGAVLLLNGIDHALPEPRTGLLAERIAASSGFAVERGLLEDFVGLVREADPGRPRFRGELVGAKAAPLLPGVWSTRTWIKLRNRGAERALEGWAEPFAALGAWHGLPDERPSLRLAWKEVLRNQAHDSICGCSRDAVHEQMRGRFDAAEELADETAARCLERLAGLGDTRLPPWTEDFELAVVNPSPHARTDVVRFALDPHPNAVPDPDPRQGLHPWYLHDPAKVRFLVDGVPARLVPCAPGAPVLIPPRSPVALEILARDVPAFGWRRLRVEAVRDAAPDEETREVEPGGAEARIEAGNVSVSVGADGRFDVRFGERRFPGLGALEDVADRGDSYDFDPEGEPCTVPASAVTVWRTRHAGGIQTLRVERRHRVPAGLLPSRDGRSPHEETVRLALTLRVAPDVERVDLDLRLEDPARDHRLRLLFPVGAAVSDFDAATTFDVARRRPGAAADEGWVQRAPRTFCHQGFVHAAGLCVAAPGLPEAELVADDGDAAIAVTLLRCVGHLSRQDLRSRPGPAGPGTETPGAQCLEPLEARLSLLPGLDPRAARDAELGLRVVYAGEEPLVEEGRPQLLLEPRALVLSALKPAEEGAGLVLRVLNPTDAPVEARVTPGFAFREAAAVRLDETPTGEPVAADGGTLRFTVPAHALRSVRLG